MMLTQQLVNGLSLGMAYALIAVGFSLIFGILNLINFAQGDVYAFAANIALFLIGLQTGMWIAILLSIVLTGLLGVAINAVGLEPLRKKGSAPITALITTLGIAYIIRNMLAVFFGNERRAFPQIFSFIGDINVFGVVIQGAAIGVLVVSAVLIVGLTMMVDHTETGLSMKAVQENQKASMLVGVNVNTVVTVTFFVSSVCAGIAGVLVGSYYQVVYPTMGFMIGLKGFAASILGGIEVVKGAIVGGLIIGLSESLAATFIGGTYRDVVAFVILILVLIVKPAGIFGKKAITKV